MNSESVDLIATDPPFNKGRDFHATPDSLASGASFQDRWSWEKDVHQEWVDKITDDFPKVMNVVNGSRNSWGDDMGAYLCFMAVRLLEMRRVLKRTGTIYLHCDPTASHYLKQLMDSIFDRKNFRNEIVWCYAGGGIPKRDFPRKHDIILRYTKSKSYTFNADAVRVPYDSNYRATVFVGEDTRAPGKTYGPNKNGKVVEDWWRDMPRPYGKKHTGSPTQKPLTIYERIISASSNEDDVVLDPFAGCATTCVAAERLGRKWVGMDIWDKTHEVTLHRMESAGLIAESAGRTRSQLFMEEMHFVTEPPERTDDGQEAVPHLRTKLKVQEPPGQRMSREDMRSHLLEQHGSRCQGCDRLFDDARYLELDHNTPRSDGGINHLSNRVLLCSPCNRAKSNQYTLSGLRKLNNRNGWMASNT